MIKARDYLSDQKILRSTSDAGDPLVSIILPTYNRRISLEKSISSILQQTVTDFELIVIDDGSTDNSSDLIESLREKDPRIVLVHHDINSGLPALRVNEGIEIARGKHVAFQFDDDRWLPMTLEKLLEEESRHTNPVVVVGSSKFVGPTGDWILPGEELNIVSLYERNRIANNSVLVPRDIVDEFGLYDCHIGMRRLCDWDLWIRYIKHVPFVVIDDIVSETYESNPNAIGLTVPWDLPLFRFFNDIPRKEILSRKNWRDYEVDGLRVGDTEFREGLRKRLYEKHIVPYYLKHRHNHPEIEGFSSTLCSQGKSVLLTKNSYDVSNEVTLNNYNVRTTERKSFFFHFELLGQVRDDWFNDNEMLLCIRTVEDPAQPLIEQAIDHNVPVGLYLDDDLLRFHEYGMEYQYIAPGTSYHQNLESYINKVDTVWVTNRYIEDSVRLKNPRTIPHNNSVPLEWLPKKIGKRRKDQPIRIGYAGSSYREEEFKYLWDAFLKISEEYQENILFEFWGIDIQEFPALASPTLQKPFTFSYFEYLRNLKNTEFDIFLSPLLDHPAPRLAKSEIKYYETAIAGALGIFSDVAPYNQLPAGQTCIKADNTVAGWYNAIKQALEMAPGNFDDMRERCLIHVTEQFTEVAQIHLHEAALRATEFHAKVRESRHEDGLPRVAYFLHSAHYGGGETQLLRRLTQIQKYGIVPIVIIPRVLQETDRAQELTKTLNRSDIQVEFIEYTCFDTPKSPDEFNSQLEKTQINVLFDRLKPALVHTVTFIPSVGQVCSERNIPHVNSLYGIRDDFEWRSKNPEFKHCDVIQSDSIRYADRWSNLLGIEKMVAREIAPVKAFQMGLQKRLFNKQSDCLDDPINSPTRLIVTGTFQERKCQLTTIEAVCRLIEGGYDCRLDLYGYTHFFSEYVGKCHDLIRVRNMEDKIAIHDYTEDILGILEQADVLLSLSTFESFPSSIKEAMASGTFVVATPVGGIPELIIDGVSGILCNGTTIDFIGDGIRRAMELDFVAKDHIQKQARRVAWSEFHPFRAANDLFMMYNTAIDSCFNRETHKTQDLVRPIQSDRSAFMVINPAQRPNNNLLIGAGLVYKLAVEKPGWCGIDVLVGTYKRKATGDLFLQVMSDSGQLLRECKFELVKASDNEFVRLMFDPIENSAGTVFHLHFHILGADRSTRIGLYESNPVDARILNIIRSVKRRMGIKYAGKTLYCKVLFTY